MGERLNSSRIAERMAAERARFLETLAQMREDEIVDIRVQEEWTSKDIVAHIAAWERELVCWLRTAARGEAPDIPAPGTWSSYMDHFNARCYADNCERPLAEIMAESHQAYQQLMAGLRELPDDPHDEVWSAWQAGQPPWGLLASFYEHYREHAEPIRAWVSRSRQRA
jgi:hypothetical protein